MRRVLMLCTLFAVLIAVFPAAAAAQCDEECAHVLNENPPPRYDGWVCTDGSSEDCEVVGPTCSVYLCGEPVALLDELGHATMTLEFCPLLNDGEVKLADIVVAEPTPDPDSSDSAAQPAAASVEKGGRN